MIRRRCTAEHFARGFGKALAGKAWSVHSRGFGGSRRDSQAPAPICSPGGRVRGQEPEPRFENGAASVIAKASFFRMEHLDNEDKFAIASTEPSVSSGPGS